jgi:fatty acid/phospholipid biosynthesis enzyme
MRRNIPHEWERTMSSSTQECADHFNRRHKIVKQNNGRKKNKTSIRMCIALISDNAAVACIADCDLGNYKGYALCNIII